MRRRTHKSIRCALMVTHRSQLRRTPRLPSSPSQRRWPPACLAPRDPGRQTHRLQPLRRQEHWYPQASSRRTNRISTPSFCPHRPNRGPRRSRRLPPAVGQGERISHAVHASTLSEATEVDGKRSILVRYGDTLENLALQHLGSRNALNLLIEANPQITDINKIFPGQKIYLSDRDKPTVRPLAAARVASRPSTAYPSDTVRNDASNAVEATRTAGDK